MNGDQWLDETVTSREEYPASKQARRGRRSEMASTASMMPPTAAAMLAGGRRAGAPLYAVARDGAARCRSGGEQGRGRSSRLDDRCTSYPLLLSFEAYAAALSSSEKSPFSANSPDLSYPLTTK